MWEGAATRLLRCARRTFSDISTSKHSVTGEAAPALAPLVDSHGRRHNYLRISLTERCNLRCQYCMPAEGVPLSARASLLSRAETLQLAGVFAALGVDRVRLTGGEPTLRADLAEIVAGLRALPGVRGVAITTNGLVLVRRLPALQRAGLSALNVSLDSLRPERYERMARRPGLPRVLAGIDLALQLGYSPVKINTVLMKGFNDDELLDFVEYTRNRDVEIRFIEFMPFTGNKWDASALVPYRTALRVLLEAHPDAVALPPRAHHTAKVWQVPGYMGRVGFITSMTNHFCSTCNRLRLTADGNLKVCLFGAAEVSLRDALRAGASDPELAAMVRAALYKKKPQHAARAARGLRGLRAGGRPQAARAPAGARGYCSSSGPFSHLDGAGCARMVDVGDKPVSVRRAVAECRVEVGPRLAGLLREARLPKGDALGVARVAGALAAKRTADLIPLCHPLPLECVRVDFRVPATGSGAVRVRCEVRVCARTGAEMEALTGAAVAALTLYDMCKSVDKGMTITGLRVTHKSGGRTDIHLDDDFDDGPNETYAPSNCT